MHRWGFGTWRVGGFRSPPASLVVCLRTVNSYTAVRGGPDGKLLKGGDGPIRLGCRTPSCGACSQT